MILPVGIKEDTMQNRNHVCRESFFGWAADRRKQQIGIAGWPTKFAHNLEAPEYTRSGGGCCLVKMKGRRRIACAEDSTRSDTLRILR